MDVALDHRLHEIEAAAVEVEPELAGGDDFVLTLPEIADDLETECCDGGGGGEYPAERAPGHHLCVPASCTLAARLARRRCRPQACASPVPGTKPLLRGGACRNRSGARYRKRSGLRAGGRAWLRPLSSLI